jgi:hypothetical protein
MHVTASERMSTKCRRGDAFVGADIGGVQNGVGTAYWINGKEGGYITPTVCVRIVSPHPIFGEAWLFSRCEAGICKDWCLPNSVPRATKEVDGAVDLVDDE